jgi:capsular polysaccharide transport system ATP-binding protein
MIKLDRVTKIYPTLRGANVVLNEISAEFPDKVNIGVMGRNGAGKSTLLRILAGTEQPDSGRVVRTTRVSWPIGFSGGFSSSLSGKENCRLVARLYGVDVDEVVGFAADFTELGTYFDMPVRTYSSGMKAKLAFGLSMAVDFDVYLVDEVTAVGDSRFQAKARKAFEDRSSRSSVIIVSHHLNTVRTYCKRCAILANGRLQHFDSVEEATKVYEA